MVDLFSYATKIGRVRVAEDNSKIVAIFFESDKITLPYREYESDLIKKTAEEIHSYLDGRLKKFTVPIKPIGTDFMLSVWEKVRAVNYGTVATYKDIAVAVGRDKAYRAVGLANRNNPIPIIIPCHRVIGSSGKLVGYAGGLEIKKTLLNIEGLSIEG